MDHKDPTCVCLSDFNPSNFTAYLADPADAPSIQTVPTDYGQVVSLLLDERAPCWQGAPDLAVVWTRPEAISPGFARLLERETVSLEGIRAEVDAFVDAVTSLRNRVGLVLVPTWTIPANDRGLGLLDWRPGVGIRAALAHMNTRLADRLAAEKSMFVLDADRWLGQARRPGFNPKLWYMAKVAFDNEVLKLAAAEVKAAIRAVRGQARKLVLLDLDGTLWGGIVGDVGWENLALGGHDPEGEAFVELQRRLKALARQGVLLGIVSKNEEHTALTAIDRHPEMLLRRDDFAAWRINWDDKAQNIVEVAAELNLGLESIVFLDDNPVERDRVRQALPEVLVPEWPSDVLRFPSALAELSCFDTASLSREDRERGSLYSAERNRKAELRQVGSVDDWLKSLEMRITLEPLGPADLPRATQLLNKTNQMNLTTRRLSEAEFWAWTQNSRRRCWTVRVEDRFGSAGLTGLLSVETDQNTLLIVDFVLSCRVFGRKVEESMLSLAVRHAREENLPKVVAMYRPTAKNKPCLDFFLRSGCRQEMDGSTFAWNTVEDHPFPAQVTVQLPGRLDAAP